MCSNTAFGLKQLDIAELFSSQANPTTAHFPPHLCARSRQTNHGTPVRAISSRLNFACVPLVSVPPVSLGLKIDRVRQTPIAHLNLKAATLCPLTSVKKPEKRTHANKSQLEITNGIAPASERLLQ